MLKRLKMYAALMLSCLAFAFAPSAHAATYDLDRNGVVNATDLELAASQINQGTLQRIYMPDVDYDGNGSTDARDWGRFANYMLHVRRDMKSLFDFDRSGQITTADLEMFASGLNGAMQQQYYYPRFDVNGDGRNDARDWFDVVLYTVEVARKTTQLLDMNRDGAVNTADLTMLTTAITNAQAQRYYYPRFDLNGDGLNDALDIEVMKAYLGVK